MKRLWFWLQKKRRMERRDCGGCCLLCKYYGQSSNYGEFLKSLGGLREVVSYVSALFIPAFSGLLDDDPAI
jgi:hypothetical protein